MRAGARRYNLIRSGRAGVRCRAGGFTLVEVVISTLLISTMVIAAIDAVGSSCTGLQTLGNRSVATLLAQDLLNEILDQYYADPALGPTSFGLGADESTGDRSLFEDVDDYDNWQASPPQRKDGTEIDWATGYQRRVKVAWTALDNPGVAVQTPTGVKSIMVEVLYNGVPLVELHALRTEAFDPPTPPADAEQDAAS